ncbi:hypothetical protein NDN08_005235 [Rhodosorus marinus]|uniref:CDP-diacylglycerol--glycerol-3-phosphate 3-phosphatidyltransferase n=1 Tax=Rhodosorus marinus TaxID=101924 RepID=A0AAV8V492_9RHOD|nr:hypothetical protein NDN08_005235 [Rhodosorus marinus]
MNLPNLLTLSRIVMCVIFVALLSVPQGYAKWQQRAWEVGYVLAVLAGFTDFLDGHFARKLNLVTEFGKFLDPLSDKIFAVAGFVVLTDKGIIPCWITVVLLSREFLVQGLRQMATGHGKTIPVSYLGKVKTTVQMLCLALGGAMMVDWVPGDLWGARILWDSLLGLTVGITAYTCAQYLRVASDIVMKDT